MRRALECKRLPLQLQMRYPLSTRSRGKRIAVRKYFESGLHSYATLMWASTVPRHLHVLRSQKLSSPDRLPKPAMMRKRACGDHRT